MSTGNNKATAVFGGGCFWCTESVFEQIEGVLSVESGYCGGDYPYPTYNDICSGETGHAEVVKIEFDPTIVSYKTLLNVFFETHDPTTLNRQGADVGTQYRSVIFHISDEQKKEALDFIKMLTDTKKFKSPIVTQVEAFDVFYKAEKYHQNYFNNNQLQPYCRFVIEPKVSKFKKEFPTILKSK